MRAVLDRIEVCPYSGSLRELYVEGKILELLALRLAGLSPPTLAARRRPLSSRQVQRLHEARAIVAQRMASPPSLRELAAQVAMSTTILKQGFRELFGETVFEHLRSLRLERARRMLVDERASVKEAGSSVGYSSLSHFARAFRQHFGCAPRAWSRLCRVGPEPR
jgi:AraC-like DNA-binding protein